MSETPNAGERINYYKYYVRYSIILIFFLGGGFSNIMLKGAGRTLTCLHKTSILYNFTLKYEDFFPTYNTPMQFLYK